MADKKYLKNVYDDFFGPVIDGVREGIKETKKTRASLDPEASLKQAEDALTEARRLFGQDVKDFLTEEELVSMGLKTEEEAQGEEKKDAPPAQEAPQEEVQEAPEKEEPDPMETLDELIGLKDIKHDVKELMDFVKIQKLRKDQGLKSVPVSLHLVFTGNPGTGKTTVARIIAKLYKKIGVLSKGQLVEVDRSGLVAGYVGQTALKCQDKIKEAMGGILFIDEADTLNKEGGQGDFGQEAIDTILKAMEDNRKDLVVIVAGYTDLMKKFVESNPGLKSRFNKYMEFPDYTADELIQIWEMNCRKYNYTFSLEAKEMIEDIIKKREAAKGENFANARDIRNMFETIITNHATRVSEMEDPSDNDLTTIMTMDIRDV